MLIHGQRPASFYEISSKKNNLFRLESTRFDLLSIRMHNQDGSVYVVPLFPNEEQPMTYQGRHETAEYTGIVRITFKQQTEAKAEIECLQGLLEIEHQQGNFSGNIEVAFLASGVLPQTRKQWLIPAFNYNGNPFGNGKYPHPKLTDPLGVRADRLAQPYILYQDNGCTLAMGLYGDAPIEGAVEGLPASLNWEMPTGAQSIILSFIYPFWEYGHGSSEADEVYYKKNEFKEAERGIMEWSGPTRFKIPFHIWFGGASDRHAYAPISWYVWNRAEAERLKQQRPLQEELTDRIQFLNSAYYDSALGPGHYRCNMAYDYAAIGFIWRSLEAAYLDWWQQAWNGSEKSGDPSNPGLNRGYRSIQHWAQYGIVDDIIMTGYQEENYCIRGDYGEQALSTRVMAEAVTTFIRCYLLSEAIGKPEPLFRQVAEKQLNWLLQYRLDNGAFARYYLPDGTPSRPAIVATGTVITVLAEAGRIFNCPDYSQAAIQAYETYRKEIIEREAFYGGTLDADTEDKEAAYFGLEAAISLYRTTGDPKYLEDAKKVADYVLTYTWAYRIRTFPKDSLVKVHQVDTWGATSVSPENQHFDPYNNTALILTGLFSGESAYTELGLAMLYFALDGRWSIPQGQNCGRKQPEQLLNTRWFYNVESVVRRGDYRDIGEEWAWPQVVPCLEYLSVGGACLDLRTGRGIGIDGCKITILEYSHIRTVISLQDTLGCSHSILLKLFNYQIYFPRPALIISGNSGDREIPWSQVELGIRIDFTAYQDLKLTFS
jgi:hypothetical protein